MTLTIGVIGLGYVGLTLTTALARSGHIVYGADRSPTVLRGLEEGKLHLQEPGLQESLDTYRGRTVHVAESLPTRDDYDVVFISVNTSIDQDQRVVLDPLAAASEAVARACGPDTLVVVRSTVPIGTTRTVVLPVLLEAWGRALVCMAPERTIQGQALREIVDLPQVVGGVDAASSERAREIFSQLTSSVVVVSDADTAEMVKLSNNAHTDLIYGFGNEIALIAAEHGVDPLEVIRACNLDYPRPDLSRPGFVGGACLSKDPHILVGCTPGHPAAMVRSARALNESMPALVAGEVMNQLRELTGEATGRTVAVLGWACKGTPPTDDVRGTPVQTLVPELLAEGVRVLGHDPLVAEETIRELGGTPTDLRSALAEADAVIVVNDHPDYRGLDLLAAGASDRLRFVYDAWRVIDQAQLEAAGIRYAGLGYRPWAMRDRLGAPVADGMVPA